MIRRGRRPLSMRKTNLARLLARRPVGIFVPPFEAGEIGPDLFRAAVCQVPLLDMLRYQNFQIAKLWIPEYGSAEDPKQFDFIYAYSPYQHVKQGTEFPAILFMTADSDTRVDPMHAKKMTALLQTQAANGPDRPILLRVDTKAGHGAGKPIGKLAEDYVGAWSFVFWQLGISE